MSSLLRKDIDFNGLFRKLGHPLEEIRVRALSNIQSKLEHKLICDADIVHEKHLYIRLLEWFNIPECSNKADILALIYRLAQHSAGSQILQDVGGIEFLSQLRCDIEPCHRPIIDQILESTMHLPDAEVQVHAPECIYHKPADNSVWGNSMSSTAEGSRSHTSQTSEVFRSRAAMSMERLGQHMLEGPGYFAANLEQTSPASSQQEVGRYTPSAADFFASSEGAENTNCLFRLSTFPWLPLTHTDQHVIASTNSSLQTRDSSMLIESCEFLADVVFQDFPAEIFLQRPEILKSLLSLVSLPNPTSDPLVVQSCKTLTCFIRCLQVRIRYFQDPALYMSKPDVCASSPSLVSSTLSSGSQLNSSSGQQHHVADWGDRRHRGDGQDGDSSTSTSRNSSTGVEVDLCHMDGDLELDEGPRPQHQQLSLPQLCVAVLQRCLPRLRTDNEALGVGVLELVQEALTVLSSVLDPGLWADGREMAREIVDRLTDCMECIAELLEFHNLDRHSPLPANSDIDDLYTHRILYMGLAAALTRFLLMIPLENMASVLPERLKSSLNAIVYDEALALMYPRCRAIVLTVSQSLGLSLPLDFQQTVDVCQSLRKTCTFCLHCEGQVVKLEELAAMAEEAMPSICYHLYLPFVSHFVQFVSRICSKKETDKSAIGRCTNVLLQLMAYPLDNIKYVCYTTILDIVKKSLQVHHVSTPTSKDSLKCKFIMNAGVVYELVCFGFADENAKVRACATDMLHHLLKSQLLMSEGLWQELILALLKSFPILQSYTDQSTLLGRTLWAMLDPTTTTHNLSLVEKFRGCLRLLYLADKKVRADAASHLRWFLGNEHGCDNKLPPVHSLDLDIVSNCLIVSNVHPLNEDSGRSVFTVEGMKQVFDIFNCSPVDPEVKRSAADQLAIMMRDPYLHASFKEQGWVEVVCSVIQQAVKIQEDSSQKQANVTPYLPACLSVLRHLTQHDFTLRHTLAKDSNLYYTLLRVSLIHLSDQQIKTEVSQLLALMLFDEVAHFDVEPGHADTPGTRFSLPAQVIQRYRLPFKPSCHHLSSPSSVLLPDASSDFMATSGPREMMRVTWNICWHGGLAQFLDSGQSKDVSNDFDMSLTLTPLERRILEISSVSWNLHACLEDIRSASSHGAVVTAIDRMLLYLGALRLPVMAEFFASNDWYTVLEKFLMVKPSSSSDQSLLLHILHFVSSVLHCFQSNPRAQAASSALTWLTDRLYRPDGPLMCLMTKSVGEAEDGASNTSIKRTLDKELIHYVVTINMCLPYQLCRRNKLTQMRGDFVRKLQQGLNITDAPHFYNLASLEAVLACLMHVTARPGWSKECSELDEAALCGRLLSGLLEVVWSFHVGRGRTSQSFMGKGVTKSTTLCLLHVAHEMIRNCDDQNLVNNWLYLRQDERSNTDQGLYWLLTLWAYRDPEVRAAGLGIAVALTSTEAGRLLVAESCKQLSGGIWGAAFNLLLDPLECSIVRQQAALLLVNLTSQTMPSGGLETRPGTWQGPLITDSEYQVLLVGVSALVALLDHTNFYASMADILTSLHVSALIQPILVTTEIPQLVDSSVSSSSSNETSRLERTRQTLLTTLSSISGNQASSQTNRSKTHSADRSKGETTSSRDITLSSSTNTESPRDLQGIWRENNFPQPSPSIPLSSKGQRVTTPGLVSAVVKLLTNLANLTPQTCQTNMRSHSLLSSLLSLVNPSTIQSLCADMASGHSGSGSALVLHDLLLLYESTAELLTACVTMDTNSRIDLLANTAGLRSMAALLLLQWHDVDDIARVCANLSVSVLKLLSSLLQAQGLPVLKVLTDVLGQIWSPLVESLAALLADTSPDCLSLNLACLDFLALLFCEESRSLVKNPDRVSDVASVSELLDAPLVEGTNELTKDGQTTGSQLCKVLVGVFDSIISPNKEEKLARAASGRLKVISALKSLLAVSQSAKQCALDAGLAESVVEYIKQTHAQLTLETLGLIKTGFSKKEEPLLQELAIIFDFLRNFMHRSSQVKVACHHSGLTFALHRLWAWCLQDSDLLSSALLLLTTYCAHCNSAAGSVTLTMPTQAATKPGGQGSLLHYILKLAQRELDRDECSPTLRQVFGLLTNLAMNSDCRNVFAKNSFVNQFSSLDPRKRRGKVRAAIEVLWCELLLALCFSIDGQQIVLKIPDSLTVLMDMIEAGSTRCQHCATLIIRNLCCHTTNKPRLLAADKLIPVLMQQIRDKTDGKTQLVAASALWALVYNNHKARVQVKSANVVPVLVDVLHKLEGANQRSQVTASTCENLRAIIDVVRE